MAGPVAALPTGVRGRKGRKKGKSRSKTPGKTKGKANLVMDQAPSPPRAGKMRSPMRVSAPTSTRTAFGVLLSTGPVD
eukprot:465143-Alexandrium_andersonii.AAC.2